MTPASLRLWQFVVALARSACLSWSRRTPNGATGERRIQGFSPQRHKDTKEHKGRAVVFSSSPCLPVSSSPCLSFRSDSRRDTCTTKVSLRTGYLHDDWWDRYLHDSRAGSTRLNAAVGWPRVERPHWFGLGCACPGAARVSRECSGWARECGRRRGNHLLMRLVAVRLPYRRIWRTKSSGNREKSCRPSTYPPDRSPDPAPTARAVAPRRRPGDSPTARRARRRQGVVELVLVRVSPYVPR